MIATGFSPGAPVGIFYRALGVPAVIVASCIWPSAGLAIGCFSLPHTDYHFHGSGSSNGSHHGSPSQPASTQPSTPPPSPAELERQRQELARQQAIQQALAQSRALDKIVLKRPPSTHRALTGFDSGKWTPSFVSGLYDTAEGAQTAARLKFKL